MLCNSNNGWLSVKCTVRAQEMSFGVRVSPFPNGNMGLPIIVANGNMGLPILIRISSRR